MSFIAILLQARLKEAASLEKHVILKKLRDSLEALKGRVGGKNNDDVADAISIVSYRVLLFSISLKLVLFFSDICLKQGYYSCSTNNSYFFMNKYPICVFQKLHICVM